MPAKRSPYGFFTRGVRDYETFLKANGWKSEYRSVQKLLNHLARRIKSEGSREAYLSWLYRFCRKVAKDPDEVLEMERHELMESLQDFVDEAGRSSGETGNLARAALGAFLRSNGFDGSERQVVQIRGFFSPARKAIEMTDYVPSREEIYRMANAGRVNNLRDRAVILLYTSGLRQGTLRGLRYMDVRQELESGTIPLKVPVYPEMKKVVPDACKGAVPYYTFITREAVDALSAHLAELQVQAGKLADGDVLFNGWKHNRPIRENRGPMGRSTMERIVKEAALRAGIERWADVHPHCLRKAFESVLREENSDGRRLDTKTQEFLMGHILPGSQENYYDRSKVEWLRQEYSKLSFDPGRNAMSKEGLISMVRRIQLSDAGYSAEEIEEQGDLTKLRPENLQQLLRRKYLGALGFANGNGQKVVDLAEVKEWVEKGFEFVSTLPDNKAVIRLPR